MIKHFLRQMALPCGLEYALDIYKKRTRMYWWLVDNFLEASGEITARTFGFARC